MAEIEELWRVLRALRYLRQSARLGIFAGRLLGQMSAPEFSIHITNLEAMTGGAHEAIRQLRKLKREAR